MRIVVLGGAAGGGFPQWNCCCRNCVRARDGDPAVRARTQSSLAVSSDGTRWLLVNASPDLRQQIAATPALHPTGRGRASPIRAIALTGAEIDTVAGLLHLRESQPLSLHASARALRLIAANPIFRALSPEFVARRELALGEAMAVTDFAGVPIGLSVEAFAVPGKVALYAEAPGLGSTGLDSTGAPESGAEAGDTLGLLVRDQADGAGFCFVPACQALTPELRLRLRGTGLLFFDGTLWTDDEMIRLGLGVKTGRRMGHLSVSGDQGAIAGLAGLGIGRKVFVHVNNTNPILIDDSPERKSLAAAGWEVAEDGMEIRL